MAFKKNEQGNWVPAISRSSNWVRRSEQASGIWGRVADGSRPRCVPALSLEDTLVGLKAAGCNYVEFHDTEAEPADAPAIMQAVERRRA